MKVRYLIKEVRQEKGLTLKKLAEKSGVSSTHINDLERGYKVASIDVLILLSKALKVPVEDLYKIENN